MSPIVKALLQALIGIAFLFALWWSAASQVANPIFVPTPQATLGKLIELVASGAFLRHFGASLAILLSGFGPAVLIVLAAAHIMDAVPRLVLGSIVGPLAAAPLIALAPVLVLWLGIGLPARIVLVFLVTLFPMLNTLLAASRPAPTADVAAAPVPDGVRRTAVVVFPALRLGLMLGVSAFTVAEMLAAQQGVGYLLMTYTATFDTAAMMATLIAVSVPTIVAGMLMQGIEEQITA